LRDLEVTTTHDIPNPRRASLALAALRFAAVGASAP
jgi:hypothetical protein